MLLILQIVLAVIATARGCGFIPFVFFGVSVAASALFGPGLIAAFAKSNISLFVGGIFFIPDIVMVSCLTALAAAPRRKQEVYSYETVNHSSVYSL